MVSFSEDLIALAERALSHAVDSVAEGGDLIPFVMCETGDETTMARFVTGNQLEESIDSARRALRENISTERAALAYDAFLTVEGQRRESVIVEAYERGDTSGLSLAQPSKRVGILRKRRSAEGDMMVVSTELPPLF